MKRDRPALLLGLLRWAPFLLALAVLASFAIRSEKFRDPWSLVNLLAQAAPTGVLAIGETFVLLTAGVDLSVGAIMFVAAAVGGKLALAGAPLPAVFLAMAAIGLAGGALNALGAVALRLAPFVITLATLFLGRGIGLWITETRAMNLPGDLLTAGAERVLGIPAPIWVFGLVLAAAHLILSRTPFGRRLYAVGHDREAARKAGIPVGKHLAAAYCLCGLCAGVSAVLTLVQLGAVSPTFGKDKEFAAIAAAVLGGVSLAGGRGGVFPGAFIGSVLIQSIASGLVILDADPYIYPLITGAIIFTAVLLDSLRGDLLEKLSRPTRGLERTRS